MVGLSGSSSLHLWGHRQVHLRFFSFKKANTDGGPSSLNRLGNFAGVVINQSNASHGFDPVTRFHLEETMELALGSNSKFKLTPGCEWLLEKAGSRREGGGRRRRRRRRRRCGSEPALEKVEMDEDEVEM